MFMTFLMKNHMFDFSRDDEAEKQKLSIYL